MNPMSQLLQPEVRELIAEGRYAELRTALKELDPVDVAEVLDSISDDEAAVAFRMLGRQAAGEAFSYLETDKQERLIHELGADGALRVVEAMEPDDRAVLLDELPGEVATRLLGAMSPENRRITQEIMGYPPESVGRLMTPDFVRVRQSWTINQAIDHLRRYGKDAETIHWVYVIDDRGRLVDDLHIRSLILADPEATIGSLLDEQFISLAATDDREEAVRMMARYDRTALPVTDSQGHLLGIVTADDIADVAEMEATEDIQKLAGVQALKEPYMSIGLIDMVKKRWPWLAALFVGEIVTILVLSSFDQQLQSMIVLALFIPLIIASGGNAGTQAASLVIRALALEEVNPGEWIHIVRREVVTGVLLGAGLGLMGVLTVLALHVTGPARSAFPWWLGLTIAIAVMSVVLWGTLLGSLLPLLMDKLGFDPAASSSPLVATLMDASGMIIYLTVAVLVLSHVA